MGVVSKIPRPETAIKERLTVRICGRGRKNRLTPQAPNDARLWPLPRWEGEQSYLEGNAPRVQGATPHFFLFSAICSGVGCSTFLNGITLN
jgi:hypothetical protein